MQLIDLLTADDVVFGIRAANVGEAAAALLHTTLPRRGFAPADVTRLVDAVLARERETPTLCGTIAIPHARDAQVSQFIVAIAVNPEGVLDAPAAPQVLIAFISPETQRSEHLDLLARLARLSRDQGAISAMAGAGDGAGVLEVIRSRPR